MSKTLGTLITLAGAGASLASAACATHGSTPAGSAGSDSVSIAYGTQQRDKSTGASTTLTSDDLPRRSVRVEDLLRGKAAGVDIVQDGNNVRLRIRGASTISQEVEPLVLVDGMAVQSGNISAALAGLTPEDIKQVNVLKDIASTSVYGGRGAGGVIVITTKRKIDK